jgi:hypothetical protein
MTISICPFYRKDTVDEAFCPFSYLEVHKETLVLETHYIVIPYKSILITFLINFLISDEEDNQEIETDGIQGVLYAKINIGSVIESSTNISLFFNRIPSFLNASNIL